MRLLVVDLNVKECDATTRLLPSAIHEISVAKDAAEALAALETREFDVILIESTLTGTTGVELLKRIRARESSTHVYIVMSAARPIPGDLRNAFLAGADDFIRKPFARDELLARIEGPTRIRRWAARMVGGGSTLDFTARSEITSIAAWASADSALCSELSDMLGFPVTATAATDALASAVRIATIPLTLASERAEVSLTVGVDAASAAALAELMLGSADSEPSAVVDMMREIANVAAGAFKRTAATEGRELTTGLPAEGTPDSVRRANAAARKQWIGTTEGTGITLCFELELRVRELKRLRVTSLCEGMVVAADLRNALGGLLLPSGTRITQSHLSGLRRSLGDTICVDVMEAA